MSKLFLGIGAQRAGTCWLHRSLQFHPDIWMPPVKETHFFDDREKSGRAVLPPCILTRRANVAFRDIAGYVARTRDWTCTGWVLRYLLLPRHISWYRGLLARPPNSMVGDITPAYSTLSDDTVQRLVQELPDLRAILILRNPIDRAFSHAVRDLTASGRRDVKSIAPDKFYNHFHSAASTKRTAYTATIERWEKFLGCDRVLVLFFEDIAEEPTRLLERITAFLRLREIDWSRDPHLHTRVNSGQALTIPGDFRAHLAEMYRTEMIGLAAKYGGHANSWLR